MKMDWSAVTNNLDVLYDGLQITLALAVISIVLSLIFGAILAAIRVSRFKIANQLAVAYIELFRNTPLLITIYLIYFGLPLVGILIPAFTSAIVALTMQHSAFVSEIIRGGFLSVPRSQIEAGRALGMTPFKTFRIVLLPQALATSLPSLVGALVILLQDTSLGAAIAEVDLTMAAKVISQRTATSFEPFLAIAAIYLVLGWLVGQGGRQLEARVRIVK
jgi:His/Glu/Gln/Arg/opine family amino acid ABC transporter permease subunit